MRSNHPLAQKLRVPFLVIVAFTAMVPSACSNKAREAGELGALAQQQFDQGQLAAARITISRAIAARDDIADLQLLRGRIEYAAQSSDTAFSAYNDALSVDPGNIEALQAVAMLGYQLGRVTQAERAADQLLTLNPQATDALLVKGLLALGKRQYPEVFAYADKVLAASPGNEGGIILKARALYQSGRQRDAVKLVETAAQATGNSPGFARIRLEMYRGLGDNAGMLGQFERLRREPQRDVTLALDEINVRYKSGDRAGARALVLQTLTLPSLDPGSLDQLIRIWGEYDAVKLTDPEIARLAAEGTSTARESVARFALAEGNPGLARQVLAGLDTAAADGLRARAQAKVGEEAAATSAADAVLRKDRTQCDALLARSEIELRARKVEPAITDGQQAVAECPDYDDAWLSTAAAFRAADQHRQVDRIFSQALQKNPQNSRIARAYTDWLFTQAQGDKALLVAQRVTRAAPSLLSGWELLRSACTRSKTSCADAEAGFAAARRRLGIDLLPGTRPPRGLLTGFDE